MTTALSVQIGGTHYKDCAIQPIQYIEANRLDFLEGCVVKRLTRHDKPTGKGRQDIEKALHELQLLLELRYPVPAAVNDNQAGELVPADERASSLDGPYSFSKRMAIKEGACKADNINDVCAACRPHGSCKALAHD
jgi:hypothetical protein